VIKLGSAGLLALMLVSPAGDVRAQEAEHHHHEEQLGTVNFPTSCDPTVQKDFERGVALLHSFWYEEAEKQFAAVTKTSPDCAMAHWGVAMSLYHQLWEHVGKSDLDRGWAEIQQGQASSKTTSREKGYLAAAAAFFGNADGRDHVTRAKAYSDGMEKVFRDNPADTEAATFYALSLLASEPPNDTTFANRKKAIPILNDLFMKNPDQPGVAHYLIHSCDKPQLAAMGLDAARRYAKIAPSSPHALHMPSHIFIRLGLWQESINSNLASIASTRKSTAMHMAGEGHQFHAMDFLQYSYMQTGDDVKAKALVDEVNTMTLQHEMAGRDMLAYGRTQFAARYAMERRQWGEAAKLPTVPTQDPEVTAITLYTRAIGSARTGDAAGARAALDQFEQQLDALAKGPNAYLMVYMDVPKETIKAWVAFAEGRSDEALRLMRAAADLQDSRGLTEVDVPQRELLADMLLELKQPANALTEYEATLKEAPGRFNALYGAAQSAELLGNGDKAHGYYAQLLQNCGGGTTSDRPELNRAKTLVAQK
jgi:tetratricopeptide (TPR) repeat protein